MALSLTELRAAPKNLPYVDVFVARLGANVRLTMLMAGSRLAWEESLTPTGELGASGAKVNYREFGFGLLARCIVDDNGDCLTTEEAERLFTPQEANELSAAARKLNGIGGEAVAEVEGKSEGSPDASGDSNSPGDSGSHIPT